jgi:threonine 3-dehydrogenase
MEKIVVEHNVDSVVHFSALLSAIGEERPDIALQVNNTGTQNVLTLAARHNLAVFCPSTIGAFGPSTPLVLVLALWQICSCSSLSSDPAAAVDASIRL